MKYMDNSQICNDEEKTNISNKQFLCRIVENDSAENTYRKQFQCRKRITKKFNKVYIK
ncbi:hypothetical protein BMW23_0157 [Bodo saltans virus]|uniref:Uncharacterized protein n=1 Tax=Bodo saltans virus TaxID=2024608 RepID=A0A2H4UTP1_9VIRU|nr:hypothetical protein QJ851_gp0153 [Bodo saltans virus]ATZ80216.1 hypothetical protein BMW23_0157 [Bodo saltans virus]